MLQVQFCVRHDAAFVGPPKTAHLVASTLTVVNLHSHPISLPLFPRVPENLLCQFEPDRGGFDASLADATRENEFALNMFASRAPLKSPHFAQWDRCNPSMASCPPKISAICVCFTTSKAVLKSMLEMCIVGPFFCLPAIPSVSAVTAGKSQLIGVFVGGRCKCFHCFVRLHCISKCSKRHPFWAMQRSILLEKVACMLAGSSLP